MLKTSKMREILSPQWQATVPDACEPTLSGARERGWHTNELLGMSEEGREMSCRSCRYPRPGSKDSGSMNCEDC